MGPALGRVAGVCASEALKGKAAPAPATTKAFNRSRREAPKSAGLLSQGRLSRFIMCLFIRPAVGFAAWRIVRRPTEDLLAARQKDFLGICRVGPILGSKTGYGNFV